MEETKKKKKKKLLLEPLICHIDNAQDWKKNKKQKQKKNLT